MLVCMATKRQVLLQSFLVSTLVKNYLDNKKLGTMIIAHVVDINRIPIVNAN